MQNVANSNQTFNYSTDYFNCLENEWSRISHPIIQELIEKLYAGKLQSPVNDILDFGCGNGLYSGTLGKLCHNLYGVDVSENAILNSAKTNNYKELKLSNGTTIPFRDESFDMIFSTEVLEHIENTGLILSELFRVLKPNGHLILTTTLYSHSIYTYIAQSKIQSHHLIFILKQLFSYLRGYYSPAIQEKFIRRWCFSPLGGHYHGFHQKQLLSSIDKVGFKIVESPVFYAYSPIPLLHSGDYAYVKKKSFLKKIVLLPVASLIKMFNYICIRSGRFANNIFIICKK
ncbi:MAG: methyltransferase domain-containing protein [Bacteroidota bacterium]